MNNNSVFNILLVITLATAGLAVFYNLYFRESYPVTVNYSFPAVHRANEPVPDTEETEIFTEELPENQLSAAPEIFYEPENADDYADFSDDNHSEFYEDYTDEEELVSVQFPLDLNSATIEELKFIPRIGDVTAQRIIQYRDYLGGYTELEQLMEIKGIAEKTFETISPYLYIE